MTPRELIDVTLQKSGWGTLAELEANRWIDCQPDFATRALSQRLRLSRRQIPLQAGLAQRAVPRWHRTVHLDADAGHCRTIGTSSRRPTAEHPFRLATSPARGFLNSTFTETPTSLAARKAARGDDPSRRRRGATASPTATRSCSAIAAAKCGCTRKLFEGVRRGVLDRGIAVAQFSLRRRPRHQYADGRGSIAPFGGAAFHDNRVWLRKACSSLATSPSSGR